MSSASVLKECLFSALIHWFWSIIGFDFGALVYWFWSIGFGAYAVTRTKKNSVLKECLCCGEVKLPGEYKARPFLQASEMKLLELIGQNSVFDIEKPFVFPEVIIRAGDQEQNGFEAEYRVYEELKKSNLHMYVFYSLKTKKNEELVDFLLVSKSSVIILEVKSFKLVDNPTVKDYETLRKKLSDNKKRQEERVKRNIKEFMSNHGCENNVDLFLYFNLFQNTKRSQLPKDADWLPKNVLFKDDYLKVIEDIINSPKKVDENGEYTLRIFLSWLYGLHISYLKTKYQWDIMKPGQIVKKQIDEEYRKKKKKDERMNKGVADVFLTPAQKAIVECDHPFLQIIGLPGTGKTYCLILKMVNVFFELWHLYRNEPHRTNELIIVFHRNKKTLNWIRGMFWQTLEKQIERQNNNKKKINCLEKIPKLIKFIGGSNVIDIETQQVFRVGEYRFGTNFKVFCDDLNWDFATFDTKSRNFEIHDVITRSNFWWLTSYSKIPALYVNSRTATKTFDSYHSVYLTDSLRYTGSIYSLLNLLYETDPMRHGWISGMDFNPGTRVIGEKPQFICVRDCNAMKDKVQMLLQKLKEEGIRRDEIAIIKTGVSKDIITDILQEDYIHLAGEVDFQSEASNLMSALGIGDDNLDIKDAHSVSFVHESDSQMNFSLRGMEFYHVIVCVTQMQNSSSDKKRLAAIKEGLRNKEFSQTLNCIQHIQDKSKKGWETFIAHDLVEAISRAAVGATIVYMEGDSFLSKIAEEFKSVSPEISQNNTCNKEYKVEQFIREYDSLSCSKSAPLVLSYQQKMRSGNYVLEVGGKTIEFAKAFEVDKIIEKKRKKRRN